MSTSDFSNLQFPSRFCWGAAAASYQIEGSTPEDGKGESVWDMFCRKPGAVFENHTGELACDHYHRYKEDVRLMKELGIGAYRLSLSWPRIIPNGTGAMNEVGFGFYDRLIDELLGAGITPWVTLFHWDYPLELFHRGGWLNPDSSDWFADYAARVVDRLSDRVTHYFTINEPQVFIGFGHHDGSHAPGIRLPIREVLQAGHHTLLGHGKAVLAMRAAAHQDLTISFAPVGMPKLPINDTKEAIELARRATFSVYESNAWSNAWWMDPVYLGQYPAQGLEFFGDAAPKIGPRDMEVISAPLDCFGVNIYQGTPTHPAPNSASGFRFEDYAPGYPSTAFNWPLTPDALYWGPKFFYERYQKPIVITENGLSCRDWVGLDGKVHDPARIDFTKRYLRKFAEAIAEGVEGLGYFHWSIMDNFEWSAGYRERFGLIHVDYQTQVRTPKDSFYWYKSVIESRGSAVFE